jgi:hypothetical protein
MSDNPTPHSGLTDVEKLRLAADFFDAWDDPQKRPLLMDAPFSGSRGAQTDLRRIADELEAGPSILELRAIIEDAATTIETTPGGAVPWLAQSLRDFLAKPDAWRRASGFRDAVRSLAAKEPSDER